MSDINKRLIDDQDEQYKKIPFKVDKKPNGVDDLIIEERMKINTIYLDDAILGQLTFGGVVNIINDAEQELAEIIAEISSQNKTKLKTDSDKITLSKNNSEKHNVFGPKPNEGTYYLIGAEGDIIDKHQKMNFANLELGIGDWLISNGEQWLKIDNTDEISWKEFAEDTIKEIKYEEATDKLVYKNNEDNETKVQLNSHKVGQNNSTENSDLRIVLSNSGNDNKEIAEVKKNGELSFNPNTSTLKTKKLEIKGTSSLDGDTIIKGNTTVGQDGDNKNINVIGNVEAITITATESFVGDLEGNAATADEAVHAANSDEANHSIYSDEAAKAIKDGNGNVITDTYSTKEELGNELKKKVDKTTTVNGKALSGNISLAASDVKAVSTEANQGLTDAEKTNARNNIGAGTSSFSGNYNDLINKPAINNATLTVQKNGANVGTFTANASENKTINVTIEKTDVTNALGYTPPIEDTNDKVLQKVNSSVNHNYPVLFSESDNNTDILGYANKAPELTYNPQHKYLTLDGQMYADNFVGDLVGVADGAREAQFAQSAAQDEDGNSFKLTYAKKSELPTVNNATLTIKQDNVSKGTFTANANENVSVNIDLSGKVDKTTTINNKALGGNISLSASDVGALSSTTTHLSGDIATSQKGAVNGVAELDANGKVPSSQLPSYVDDVLEYTSKASFPTTGETGKIYIDKATNLTYRWSGSAYVEISPSLALGETSSTAYAGDKGKAVADGLKSHTGNTTVHITAAERTSWNEKSNPSETGYSLSVNGTSLSLKNKTGTVLSTVTTQDKNDEVSQIYTSTSGSYRVLFSSTDSNADQTTFTRKHDSLLFNPATETLTVKNLSGNASTAIKATQDGSGNNIVNTYATKKSVDDVSAAAQTTSGLLGAHLIDLENPHQVTKAQVGLGNVGNYKAVSTVASQGLTDTEKSNARANIGAGTSSFSGSYNDLTNKPTITDTKVSQIEAGTDNSALEVLLSKTASTTTETDTVKKSQHITFNPRTGIMALTDMNNAKGSINADLNGTASDATHANKANYLDVGSSGVGSGTQPIYINGNGAPVTCSYSLGKSVPSDAKFTDTNTWRPLGTTADTACAGNDSRLSNARPPSFANNTLYTVGDDVKIGDQNVAGTLIIQGANADGAIQFRKADGTVMGTAIHTGNLSKDMVTKALGYTPPTTNTTYSAGTGLSLSGTTFSNSGVRSISKGSTNGTISVNTNGTSSEVSVAGLGSAAYHADSFFIYSVTSGDNNGQIKVTDGNTTTSRNVNVTGLKSAAYTESSIYATAKNNGVDNPTFNSDAAVCHIEGSNCTVGGGNAHAEGFYCKAIKSESHAGGKYSEANGTVAFAHGEYALASRNSSVAFGAYNIDTNNSSKPAIFVVGGGTGTSSRANLFRVREGGYCYASNSFNGTGADYAEFFEWEDGNLDNEDRIGYFVTLEDNKIKIASDKDDYILGIISGGYSMAGNTSSEEWNERFLKDEFNRPIMEPKPKMIDELDENGNRTGNMIEVEGEYDGEQRVVNPEYDNTKEYIPREQRPEWSAVGMLGVLPVRQDGTAKVNGYVTVNENGIATVCDRKTENSYRVTKVKNENVIEVIFR